ncbi:MAG: hypothetical protein INR65_19880 [Gluconacetobacter diazotrophicus]|nr:hypothetical protein [Gluconacetobacter diazotrophicus]
MLTRTAIYEGALEPGTDEDAFFQAVRERLEPVWRTFPEVRDVRVHRVREADPGAIPVIMILEMDFADANALKRSLASDIKERSHALTLEVLKPFKGRFFHLVAEAHSVPEAA